MLAVNAGVALDANVQAVFASIWLEGLGDLAPNVLLAAFQKTLRVCPFWPVKVADIRKHVANAETNAANVAAEESWERVLEIRRVSWNPDLPGAGLPKFSEHVGRAVRASGIFNQSDMGPETLHVWAKKRFIESYLAWEELEQNQSLLPDGELKNLLVGIAERKALPSTSVDWNELHARGLEYAKTPNVQSERAEAANAAPTCETRRIVDVEGRTAELQRQKQFILQKYARPGNGASIPAELRLPMEVSA